MENRFPNAVWRYSSLAGYLYTWVVIHVPNWIAYSSIYACFPPMSVVQLRRVVRLHYMSIWFHRQYATGHTKVGALVTTGLMTFELVAFVKDYDAARITQFYFYSCFKLMDLLIRVFFHLHVNPRATLAGSLHISSKLSITAVDYDTFGYNQCELSRTYKRRALLSSGRSQT